MLVTALNPHIGYEKAALSLVPSSAATCLLSRPATILAITSRSRGVRESYRRRSSASSCRSRRAPRSRSIALPNRVEQILFAKWLRQKFDRAGLHGPDRHGNVAVPGEEDDRQRRVRIGKLALKVEATQPREPHVEHETARSIGSRRAQKRLGAREDRHGESTEVRSLRRPSRTDRSSSTTKTMGPSELIGSPDVAQTRPPRLSHVSPTLSRQGTRSSPVSSRGRA